MASYLLMIISMIISQLKHKRLQSARFALLPLLTQVALLGILPISALQLPHYPLLTGNAIILTLMSILNIFYFARAFWQWIVCYLIQAVCFFMAYFFY